MLRTPFQPRSGSGHLRNQASSFYSFYINPIRVVAPVCPDSKCKKHRGSWYKSLFATCRFQGLRVRFCWKSGCGVGRPWVPLTFTIKKHRAGRTFLASDTRLVVVSHRPKSGQVVFARRPLSETRNRIQHDATKRGATKRGFK